MQLKAVLTHCGVEHFNPCYRSRDVVGSISSYIRWVSSVLIATASKGSTIYTYQGAENKHKLLDRTLTLSSAKLDMLMKDEWYIRLLLANTTLSIRINDWHTFHHNIPHEHLKVTHYHLYCFCVTCISERCKGTFATSSTYRRDYFNRNRIC